MAATGPGTGPTNTFVEGDNLVVLRRLAREGRRFGLVYLDPPYNTGNVFAYDDRRGGHEAWVAEVRPRLEAVRDVLAPEGVVVASIDDHEVARLRLLLDEVLGERSFLAQVVVNLNPKGRQLGRWFATSHEYLLVHARDPARCVLDPTSADAVDPRDFGLTAPDGRRYRELPLRNTNKRFNPATAPTLHYPLHGDPVTGAVTTSPTPTSVVLEPVFGDGTPAVWRWSARRVDERPGDLVCRPVRGRLGPRLDVFQRDWLDGHDGAGRRKKLTTIWHAQEIGSTDTAVAELKALVGHVFETPKPTGLLRRVLGTLPPDVAVLDPYAGSGTTGHATVLANRADGGTRTCLSIELGDPVRPGSHAARADRHDLRTVADVTRARLRAVDAALGGGLDERVEPASPGPGTGPGPA